MLNEKDSENTLRSTKVAKELFDEYYKEKNIHKPDDKKETNTSVKILSMWSVRLSLFL